MSPGPAKSFDPGVALERARDVFWRRGYDGTAISQLESELGIGRKSLYDTFGDKRALYLRALQQYTDTVIARICAGLEDARSSPLENVERVLGRLAQHHGSEGSLGCLLGVALGQIDAGDDELAGALRGHLGRLEVAFERALGRAQEAGEVAGDVRPRDAARHLVALTQGMALTGRIQGTSATQRSVVRAALRSLRP